MDDRIPIMIACLAKVAWADGKLLPVEANFFQQVIEALEISPQREKQAWQAVVCPPSEITEEQVALLSSADRAQILALSFDMAGADSDTSDEERDVISQLQDLFSR